MNLSLLEKGVVMHPAILGIAIGMQLLTPVSDQVPKLDVEATCKASVQADKSMSLDLPQSYETCMADENTAEKQLAPIWSSYSAPVQASCYDEAVAAGIASYVDLLICLQMNDPARTTPVTNLRGASRKRPTN
jgi:hypothetical protein